MQPGGPAISAQITQIIGRCSCNDKGAGEYSFHNRSPFPPDGEALTLERNFAPNLWRLQRSIMADSEQHICGQNTALWRSGDFAGCHNVVIGDRWNCSMVSAAATGVHYAIEIAALLPTPVIGAAIANRLILT
jgi:hypothetical protein